MRRSMDGDPVSSRVVFTNSEPDGSNAGAIERSSGPPRFRVVLPIDEIRSRIP